MIERLFACIALAIISPFFILIILCVILVDGRPVFFKQERLGKFGETFVILKFRTMSSTSNNQLETSNILISGADKRITRLGMFLRKTSLDELPQLINIVQGKMSFVGPRPILPDQLKAIGMASRHNRFIVKPGITGLAQIRGRRGLNWLKQLQYDSFYANHKSSAFDLQIILNTLVVLFSTKGVYGSVEDNWRNYINKKK
jgi:lipopolysaccharide/colanic/teichoic acid biosynthesis glycosyltransferase